MTATTTETDVEVLLTNEDEAGCEAQWSPDAPECGKPAKWRITGHNLDCQWETANFCQPCTTRLLMMSAMSACAKCLTTNLLKDIRPI